MILSDPRPVRPASCPTRACPVCRLLAALAECSGCTVYVCVYMFVFVPSLTVRLLAPPAVTPNPSYFGFQAQVPFSPTHITPHMHSVPMVDTARADREAATMNQVSRHSRPAGSLHSTWLYLFLFFLLEEG